MVQRLARRAYAASFPLLFGFSILSRARICAAVALVGLGMAGCAQQPQQLAAAGHSKEYFPSSVYGPASRRVIADGQPVPRGGGQYLVGKPYTIAGQTYYPSERRVTQVGLASWYGDAFHGRLTANGEIYDRDSFTAAHPTMPLPSYARVTNLRNSTSMIVRVNDRGPYHSNRVMDVSRRVAEALDIRRTGTAKVKVEWVGRASLAGSDDAKLAATLRSDGPARADGIEGGVMVAAMPAAARVASLGAFYPTQARPAPIVEEQRPEQLETYRARPPVHHMETTPHQVEEPDEIEATTKRDHVHSQHDTSAPRRTHEDEEATTGSLPRSHREPVKLAAGHHDEALRFARQELLAKPRDHRVARNEPVLPTLRHGSHVVAEERILPPSRPSRIALIMPPARPRAVAMRSTRSHED